MTTPADAFSVSALRVKQWLPEWERVNFDPLQNQAKPEPHFYVFSMSAAQLRKLSAIYRRDATDMTARKEDLGIQRRHDPERSAEIRRYVVEGPLEHDAEPAPPTPPGDADVAPLSFAY